MGPRPLLDNMRLQREKGQKGGNFSATLLDNRLGLDCCLIKRS
jgi:hypothetical protein